jgi:hypothetical protein
MSESDAGETPAHDHELTFVTALTLYHNRVPSHEQATDQEVADAIADLESEGAREDLESDGGSPDAPVVMTDGGQDARVATDTGEINHTITGLQVGDQVAIPTWGVRLDVTGANWPKEATDQRGHGYEILVADGRPVIRREDREDDDREISRLELLASVSEGGDRVVHGD